MGEARDGWPAAPGTVAKSLPPEGLGHAFVVALAGQVVSAFDPQLCPALEVGDEVEVRARAELEEEKGESARAIADVAKLASEDNAPSKKKGVAGLFSGGSSSKSKDNNNDEEEEEEEEEDPEGQGQAVVVSVDASRWGPSFTVRLLEGGDGKGKGKEIVVTDRRLASFPLPSSSSSSSSPSSAPPPLPLPPPKVPKGDPPPFAAAHAPPPAATPPPVVTAALAAAPAAAAPSAPPSTSFTPSLKQITEAVKAAKCAVSSLQFEDVSTGVRLLREALELLTTEPQAGAAGKKK